MKKFRLNLVLTLILLCINNLFIQEIGFSLNQDKILIAASKKKEKNKKNIKQTKQSKQTKQKSKHSKSKKNSSSYNLSSRQSPEDVARSLIDSRQYSRAYSILMARVAKEPKNQVAYYLLGRIATKNRDFKAAVGFFKKSKSYIEPDSSYEYGIAHYQVKNYFKAAHGFSSIDPSSPLKNISYFYAAICYIELGKITQAEKYFRKAKHLPVKYADLKERYLESIQQDNGYGGSSSYTFTSRMALPPMKGITESEEDPDSDTKDVDDKNKDKNQKPGSKKSFGPGGIGGPGLEPGFNFGASFNLSANLGGGASKTTYHDVIETSDFSLLYGAGGEARVQPMYVNILESGRDLTVGFPLGLTAKYSDGNQKSVSGKAAGGPGGPLGGGSPPSGTRLISKDQNEYMDWNQIENHSLFYAGPTQGASAQSESIMDKISFALGFNPYISVPIGKDSSIGAKNDLSVNMIGTNTESMKMKNFTGLEYKTRFSSLKLGADLGFSYDLSGIMIQKTDFSQQAAAGSKGITGGANLGLDFGETGGFNSSASVTYNLQSEENLAQAVTNDMVLKAKAGVILNGIFLTGDFSVDYTKNVPNSQAVVEGSKTDYTLSAKLTYNLRQILDVSTTLKHKVYPEYVYQNDTGYITSEGASESVALGLNLTPWSFVRLGAQFEYTSNDYGIDDTYASTFYSKEKGHSLQEMKYNFSVNLMYNF